jgi:hypothetical protein
MKPAASLIIHRKSISESGTRWGLQSRSESFAPERKADPSGGTSEMGPPRPRQSETAPPLKGRGHRAAEPIGARVRSLPERRAALYALAVGDSPMISFTTSAPQQSIGSEVARSRTVAKTPSPHIANQAPDRGSAVRLAQPHVLHGHGEPAARHCALRRRP